MANVTHRGEDLVAATRRVAPYVRQTHLKDAFVVFVEDGVQRQVRPCGQGMIDFDAILPLLYKHNPRLNLSIENPTAHGRGLIQIFDPVWQASHPDLTVGELAEYVRLVNVCERRVASGEAPDLDAYEGAPFDYEAQVRFIQESADYLRTVCGHHALGYRNAPREPPRDI